MSTIEVLKIVKERGMTLTLQDGRPVLHDPCKANTPELLRVLKIHRLRIIKLLEQGNG